VIIIAAMNYAIFRKPSRYIGKEVNIIRKEARVKTALCFPDSYEIGMSHLGLKILYSIINNIPDASAERIFAPWVDMETYLREQNLLLTSLEFQRPLKDFDIVGFTLQYELSFTNILNMLNLGGIPLRSSQRNDNHPLVIAGGPCAVNPLPLAPFIDAFVIGDGEDVIKEIIAAVSESGGREQEAGFRDKDRLLKELSQLKGIYVPSIHDAEGKTIRKRIVEDLDKAPYFDSPVLPYAQLVHDRVAIEVARGCTRGCRFCQAGMIYRPLRERSPETVLSIAEKSINSTGYDEISFASLSTGDYSCLLPVLQSFNSQYKNSNISISLPSLRVGSLSSDVLKEMKKVRQTGFTIAPEAGTARLRNVINKNISDEEYEETLTKLFTEGWSNVKLYFMIGLPTETRDDINGLIDMAIKAIKKGRQLSKKRVNVNVGVSSFVPKPHTPFQWTGQNSLEELREKQDYIKNVFRKKKINFKGSPVELSILEAVFSRGDRDCALLLEEAWKLGCRFDGWSEHFDFEKWLLAAEKASVDLRSKASHSFNPDDDLPWDFIDIGVNKSFLKSEYRKALQEEITVDCRETCSGCGLECEPSNVGRRALNVEQPTEKSARRTMHDIRQKNVPGKFRIRFSKTGDMRYLSHNELFTSIFRALKRANIPIAYSEGFHPRPKFSFGPALPSGVEGLSEFFEIELMAYLKPDDFLNMANSKLPDGLKLLAAVPVSKQEKSLSNLFSRYEYEAPIGNSLINNVKSFMDREHYEVAREKKTVDIRPMVESARIEEGKLHIVLADTEKANVRLYEALEALLQMPLEKIYSLIIKRTGLYGYNSEEILKTEREDRICQAK
jgi:radical SAM family uncharacterized protein/radical SAM-linked protein